HPGFGWDARHADRGGLSRPGVRARVDHVRDRDPDLHAARDLRRSRLGDGARLLPVASTARSRARAFSPSVPARAHARAGSAADARRNMNVVLIEDQTALKGVCSQVGGVTRVALDTEFHNERSYAPRLMVLQMMIGENVFIVDALRVRDLQPLADALAPKTVVGHALQSDLKIFADRFDRLPAAAFDTQ